MTLTFTSDGNYRIAQVTDIHLQHDPFDENDEMIVKDIERGLRKINPNLIVVTGDIVDTYNNPEAPAIFQNFFKFLNRFDVPIAVTYGNHDSEPELLGDEIDAIFEETVKNKVERKHEAVFQQRPNYAVEVMDADGEKVQQVLYVIDTGQHSPDHKKEFDWILPEQVQWFKETAAHYEGTRNNLVFLHLPIQEYKAAKDNILSGELREPGELISVGRINTGLFSELYFSKQIYGVFCGHNHLNNAEFLYEGIHLFYGLFSGKEPKAGDFRGIRYIDYKNHGEVIESECLFYTELG